MAAEVKQVFSAWLKMHVLNSLQNDFTAGAKEKR